MRLILVGDRGLGRRDDDLRRRPSGSCIADRLIDRRAVIGSVGDHGADVAARIGHEAAQTALKDAFSPVGLNEVLAYTADGNLRSQAVMARLHMQRDPSRDFTLDHDGVKAWRGLVWMTRNDA